MRNLKLTNKEITGLGLLIAIEAILCFLSNYVSFGSVNVNLALIPIVIASFAFGPLGGLIIGLENGLITIIAPSTLAMFMPVNAFGTIILCLVKTGAAGFLCGLVFDLLKKKHEKLAMFLCAAIVPFVNTTLFIGGVFVFFKDMYSILASEAGADLFVFVLTTVVTINFIIEIITTTALSGPIFKKLNFKRA